MDPYRKAAAFGELVQDTVASLLCALQDGIEVEGVHGLGPGSKAPDWRERRWGVEPFWEAH